MTTFRRGPVPADKDCWSYDSGRDAESPAHPGRPDTEPTRANHQPADRFRRRPLRSVLHRILVAVLVTVVGSVALAGTASAQAAPPAMPDLGAVTVGIDGPPELVAVTPDQRYAWVSGGQSVSVVDLRSRALVSTIPVDPVPLGIAFNRSGSIAYVASAQSQSITVINVRSRTVTTVLKSADYPIDVAVRTTSNGEQLYVALQAADGNDLGGAVALLDPTTGAERQRWAIAEPAGVVLTRSGLLVAPSGADNDVLILDTATGKARTVKRPDGSPTNPGSLSVRGDTVVLPGDDTTWLNARTGTFTGAVDTSAFGVTSSSATTTNGRYTLLTSRGQGQDSGKAGTLSVVATCGHRVVNTVTVGARPTAVAVAGNSVLVAQGPAANGTSSLLILPWKQAQPSRS